MFAGRRADDARPAVLPPWTQWDRIKRLCDGCGECLPACADGLISLGPDGFPRLDFKRGGCTICGACADACPTGAIPTAGSRAGAAFPHRLEPTAACLSLRGIDCRICEDSCEVQAIRFRPRAGGHALPAVSEAACTGCGACLAVCPETAFRLVRKEPGNAAKESAA